MAYQQYHDDDWKKMRPIIEDLLYSEAKTYDQTASILKSHYGFRVKYAISVASHHMIASNKEIDQAGSKIELLGSGRVERTS